MKLTKTEKVNMAEYNYLSVHAILNIFLETAFYICFFFWKKVPFAYQFKTIEKNIKQFSDSSGIEIESE